MGLWWSVQHAVQTPDGATTTPSELKKRLLKEDGCEFGSTGVALEPAVCHKHTKMLMGGGGNRSDGQAIKKVSDAENDQL